VCCPIEVAHSGRCNQVHWVLRDGKSLLLCRYRAQCDLAGFGEVGEDVTDARFAQLEHSGNGVGCLLHDEVQNPILRRPQPLAEQLLQLWRRLGGEMI